MAVRVQVGRSSLCRRTGRDYPSDKTRAIATACGAPPAAAAVCVSATRHRLVVAAADDISGDVIAKSPLNIAICGYYYCERAHLQGYR